MDDKTIVIDDPEGIELFHMMAQLSAMKLEAKGLRHSRGRSVTAHIRRVYKLTGNRDRVIEQFAALIEAKKDDRIRQHFSP